MKGKRGYKKGSRRSFVRSGGGGSGTTSSWVREARSVREKSKKKGVKKGV
jgi:hypothetical protein